MSDASWSSSLRKITELELPDHPFLDETDECLYFGNYTARAGFNHSDTNQLILNLKKKPAVRNTPQWRYKLQAIRRAAGAINSVIREDARPDCVLIPMPPSKVSGTADYDDRMLKVAEAVPNIDICECIRTVCERCAAHESDVRPSEQELRASLDFGPTEMLVGKRYAFVLDDVLTTGRSFRVAKAMVLEKAPNISVVGLFIARVARPAIDWGFEFENIDE